MTGTPAAVPCAEATRPFVWRCWACGANTIHRYLFVWRAVTPSSGGLCFGEPSALPLQLSSADSLGPVGCAHPCSYELAKMAWRRMTPEHKAAERERDRSGRKRPADDGAQAARRSRVKREAKARDAAAAYRVVDTHTYISADGRVHLLVAPSEVPHCAPRTRDTVHC